MKVTIDDELTVEWAQLGEGLQGDYDPDNPEDVEVLRLDVIITEAAAERYRVFGEPAGDGQLFTPDGCSAATNVPADIDPREGRLLLARIGAVLHAEMVADRPLRRAVERLSWVGGDPEDDERIFETFDA